MQFRSPRRQKTTRIKHFWSDYVFGKQTFRELSRDYALDRRTIRGLLEHYTAPQKAHHPRPIYLVTDGVYFGERTEKTSWCVVVVRDPEEPEDLVWRFPDTEATSVYRSMREELERKGYAILSVTGDGFGGIRSAFSGIPFQMCHVHMERMVTRGTTKHPQTEAGRVLLALVRTLHDTNKKTFNKRLALYCEHYRHFLNEKTTHPLTGEQYWTHKELRSAALSLLHFQKYLFTYAANTHIAKTTNSLEGRFSHLRDVADVHRGLSRTNKQKVINTILLASTVAPSKETLADIL